MRSSHSPTIRSRYDYYYSSMSPASSAANFYDNQNQSLFGDPITPSMDFLETLDNHLYGSFRRGSSHTVPVPPAAVECTNEAFIDDFMDAQNSAHRLQMSAKHHHHQRPSKDRSAPPAPGDSAFRDEFRFDNKRRSSSSFSDEFRANLDTYGSESEIMVPTAPKRLFPEEPINYRNIIPIQSSDSQSNGHDWIRPHINDGWKGYQRPTSRNVMHIDHGSAMTAVLPESSTPSSGGDDIRSASGHHVRQIQVLPYQDKNSRPATVIGTRPITNESSSEDYLSTASPPKRDVSPAIVTSTINTGSEFRLQPSRLHKKTSFTIINELEPNQSRPASPTGGRASPFRGKGFRVESSKRFSRPVSCPESPRNMMEMDTPSSHDDSHIQTKPSVHFNIIPPIPRKRTAIRVIEATTDENDSRGSYGDVSYHDRDMESFTENGQIRSSANLSRRGSLRGPKPSPAPRHHIQRSADDLLFTQPIVNPRSYHKGLLGVVSGGGAVQPSRIPRRKSSVSTPNISRNSSISMVRRDSRMSNSTDRFSNRRDSSSVSPRRRRKSSNELGGSMIDLGMGPSTSLAPSRSLNRISKPTTLSPIVGTPNKDCDQDSSRCGNDAMDGRKFGNDSPTKIPIRRSSSINVNGGSRAGSRVNSRETSPMKGSMNKSPTKIPQKINAKASSPSKGAKIDTKTGSTKSIPNSVNKESSSAKKEPAINREKSSVKKAPPATIKREPSTLKRQPSNLKRENSQQKLKRENSMIGIGGSNSGATAKPNARRDPNTSTLSKNQSDSSLAKRLEKKNSFKQKRRTSSESDGLNEINTANLSDKLIPLTTKSNGVSMTTAAVTSQPVQITTAVTDHLSKKNSSGQIVNNDNSNVNSDNNNNNISSSHVNDASTKTDTTAGSEATATTTTAAAAAMANDTAATSAMTNATNGKKSDEEMKKESDKAVIDANGNATTKMDSTVAVLEKKSSTRTLGDAGASMLGTSIVPENIERELIGTPIETKVNVIDNTLISGMDSEALLMKADDIIEMPVHGKLDAGDMAAAGMSSEHRLGDNMDKDNGITSHAAAGAKNETSENGDADSDEPTTCCKLCKCCTPCYASALCLPCRRLKKLSCCNRAKKLADEQKAAEIATSILHESEKKATSTVDAAADSCWKHLKCCNRKSKQASQKMMDEVMTMEEEAARKVTTTAAAAGAAATTAVAKERGKCALCLAKVFCCRKTNKIQTSNDGNTTGNESDEESTTRCCSCLPCRRKKKEPMAWSERRQDSLTSTENMPKKSCCGRLCEKLICCKKKSVVESRRTSMNSKKQSIAPTLPPEDTRPKLDESLVDHTSIMKAAIPVLPTGLAWFCLICNCLIPGSGTIFSGLFCLCLGIPRFSQHDGARARIGSFFVNCIVGVAQAFTLIFCLVGWGWSIWWGMIMLRTAKKHRKLLQAEETDLEEAQTIASHSTTNQAPQNQRDIEAGRKRN
ncbi:protein stum [Sitodiplosis mosellana]|uniref:protein stum n=1 Tax=Sitodiplosis mosellana TaxID=263140 RepID=UPI002444770C|nr:protein stum [Sitodiplosis mosellana]XP_055314699.1 protein stum [Sitodiplosis mosellana]XP_055314700.1 protein stum [Sitodiplosis mosellana]